MFKVEESNGTYVVIPTASYLQEHFDRFSFPYDTNWEIYKLYNYEPRQFFEFVISAYKGNVKFQEAFPYALITFNDKKDAEAFKADLETRAQEQDKK